MCMFDYLPARWAIIHSEHEFDVRTSWLALLPFSLSFGLKLLYRCLHNNEHNFYGSAACLFACVCVCGDKNISSLPPRFEFPKLKSTNCVHRECVGVHKMHLRHRPNGFTFQIKVLIVSMRIPVWTHNSCTSHKAFNGMIHSLLTCSNYLRSVGIFRHCAIQTILPRQRTSTQKQRTLSCPVCNNLWKFVFIEKTVWYNVNLMFSNSQQMNRFKFVLSVHDGSKQSEIRVLWNGMEMKTANCLYCAFARTNKHKWNGLQHSIVINAIKIDIKVWAVFIPIPPSGLLCYSCCVVFLFVLLLDRSFFLCRICHNYTEQLLPKQFSCPRSFTSQPWPIHIKFESHVFPNVAFFSRGCYALLLYSYMQAIYR